MKITIRTLVVALSLMLAVLAFGCGGAETEAELDSETPAVGAETTAPAETGEVAYEPAYPEDVSTEELSVEDTAQQHMHEDGEEHMHEDGEEQMHDEATEDDHGHDH